MRIFAIASAVLVLAACNPLGPDGVDSSMQTIDIPAIDLSQAQRTDNSYQDDDWSYEEFNLDAAVMTGTLPHIGQFDDGNGYGTVALDSWDGHSTLSLNLNTLDSDGWGMIGAYLNIDAETGTATYSAYDVVGCSGEEEYDAEFDAPPSTADITADVIDVDGVPMVEFQITGEFEGEPVTGVAIVPAAVDEGE